MSVLSLTITVVGYRNVIENDGSKYDPYGQPFDNLGTLIPLGGGAFLTAAHLFDEYTNDFFDTRFQYSLSSTTIGGSHISGVFDIRPWSAETTHGHYSMAGGANDLAVVTAPISSPTADLTPLVVFADRTAATIFLARNGNETLASATSNNGSLGSFYGVTGDGQFKSSIRAENGDSGGAAVVTVSGNGTSTSYVAGILSASAGGAVTTVPTGPSFFSYLSLGDLYSAMSHASSQDYSGMAPDLYKGYDPGEGIRGTQRKADIITNGSNDVIVAGSGGGLIDTGVGQNDIIDLSDSSSTSVVFTPGTTTVIGASAGDSLILLDDRLPGGSPSDVSDAMVMGGGTAEIANTPPGTGIYDFFSGTADDGYSERYTFNPFGTDPADLLVTVAVDAAGALAWNGSLLIKDYQAGDFGLALGSDPVQQQPVTENYVDDDSSVQWTGTTPYAGYEGYADSNTPNPGGAELAAETAAVRAETGGGTQVDGGGSPDENLPAPVTVAAFEQSQSQLDSTAGGFWIQDTGANIAADLNALNDDSSIKGIVATDAFSTPFTISIAQALSDQNALQLVDNKGVLAAADSPSNVESLTVAQIDTLGQDRVASINLAAGPLSLDVAQAQAIGANAIQVNAADGAYITDTSSNISQLSSADIANLTSSGLTNEQVTLNTASFDVASGFSADISGSNASISAEDYASVIIEGSGNSVSASTYVDATLNGNDDAVNASGSNDTVDVGGTNESANLTSGFVALADGASVAVSGDNDIVQFGANGSGTITGSGNTINFAGTGDVVTADSATMNLWDGAGTSVTGNANTIALNNNDVLGVSGSSNVVGVGGTGNTITIASGEVDLWDNAAAVVTGDGNTLAANSNGILSASGADANLTINGSGNSITLTGANAVATVGSTSNSLAVAGGTISFSTGPAAA